MLPLQSPFLPALLVLDGGLLVCGVAAACYWAYLDARARDLSPSAATFWAVMVLFGGLGGLCYLLVVRPRAGPREYPPTRRERAALVCTLASVGAMVPGAVLTPPDPHTQLLYFPAFLLVAFPLAALYVVGAPRRWLRAVSR